jgi:hypothetical protein
MRGLGVVAPGVRGSQDLEVFVRDDGALYLEDDIIVPLDLPGLLQQRLEELPDLRVVIYADERTSWSDVQVAIGKVREAGVEVSVEIPGGESTSGSDPFFPAGGAEALEMGLTASQAELLKPKHGKLPQNPYGTTDFTAYTLEWGEARIGLVDLTYGIAPRVQLSTVPLLDAALTPNATLKGTVMKEERFALAFSGSYYGVLLRQIGDSFVGARLGLSGTAEEGEALYTARAGLWGLSGVASMRITDSMSFHARLNYLNANASGQFDLSQVPVALAPGLDLTDTTLVPKIIGETVYFSMALDQRFNRRDSLIVRFRGPLYASARGVLSGSDLNADAGYDVIGAYRQWVSPLDYYSATLGWQFQWRHLEARVGVGTSLPQWVWLLQTFELGYRFGGPTRVEERKLRKGYRENLKDLEGLGDAPLPPPPVD